MVWSGSWSFGKEGSTPTAVPAKGYSITDSTLGYFPGSAFSNGRFAVLIDGDPFWNDGSTSSRGEEFIREFASCATQIGVRKALEGIDGPFAMAIWDFLDEKLYLVRDSFGQKNVYYGWSKGAFYFGTRVKETVSIVNDEVRVDKGALKLFLRHAYVPAPHCIYTGFYKLLAGHMAVFDRRTVDAWQRSHIARLDTTDFGSVRRRYEGALADPMRIANDPAGQCIALLERAMANDASAKAFLSGGVDSSLICAVHRKLHASPLETYSIGFSDTGHDETGWATAVASHLGCRHTFAYLSGSQALDSIQDVAEAWCEPIADPSQVPTLMAMKLLGVASSGVLAGDGGDELFLGHAAHRKALSLTVHSQRLPKWVKDLAQRYHAGASMNDYRTHRLSAALGELCAVGVEGHYLNRVSRWRSPSDLVKGGIEPGTAYTERGLGIRSEDLLHRLSYLDTALELSEGILTKVNRAGDFYFVQPRFPYLNREVAKFAWSLPPDWRVRNGSGKFVLRQALLQFLPQSLADRPKRGFGPPVSEWLLGPMRPWAEELLSVSALSRWADFDLLTVREVWERFVAGERKLHSMIWPILMFQHWRFSHSLSAKPSPTVGVSEKDSSSLVWSLRESL